MPAKKKKFQQYSGIGGQAVLEGVMMRNKSRMAVAVRKSDGEIEVGVDEYHGIGEKTVWVKIPLIRGVLSFLDSLVTGMKAMNFASSFYEDEEGDNAAGNGKPGKEKTPEQKAREERAFSFFTILISLVLAIGIFIALPLFIIRLMSAWIRNEAFMALMEGIIRLVIFLIYMIAISAMKDIRRLYGYHGAEHKCINCLERGKPLTVRYVQDSSRFHKRCGSSFIILILIISVILFFFIRVDNYAERLILRIALVPLIAGIAFEFLRYAGKHNNTFVDIISAPGVWLQHITTKEPDASMIEVAIASVEAVFDWRAYLKETFGYNDREIDEIMQDAAETGSDFEARRAQREEF